jgi:hypothetical protein
LLPPNSDANIGHAEGESQYHHIRGAAGKAVLLPMMLGQVYQYQYQIRSHSRVEGEGYAPSGFVNGAMIQIVLTKGLLNS